MSKKEIPKLGYRKVRGMIDLFLMYPYKKNYESPDGVIPRPYVPTKNLVEDHKYSLDYYQYSEIVKSFYKHLIPYLMEGSSYRMSNRLGDLKMYKWKPKNGRMDLYNQVQKIKRIKGNENLSIREALDYGKKNKVPITKIDNRHTDNYSPLLKWYKTGSVYFAEFWHFRFVRSTKKLISKILMDNPHKIHNLDNISK